VIMWDNIIEVLSRENDAVSEIMWKK